MPKDGLRLTTHILKQLQRGNLEIYQKGLIMGWSEVDPMEKKIMVLKKGGRFWTTMALRLYEEILS